MLDYFRDYIDRNILINEVIKESFDCSKFNELYDVYSIVYTGNRTYLDFNSKIFDRLDNRGEIVSVSFVGGRKSSFNGKVNVMMPKGEKLDLNSVLAEEEQSDFLLEPFELTGWDKDNSWEKMDVIYNLLLCGLSKYEDDKVYSNTRGQLYLHVPLSTRKKACKEQIIMESIKVKKGLLIMTQKSFIPYDHELHKKYKDSLYSIYRYGPKNTCRVVPYRGERDTPYINKGFVNNKVIVDVDNINFKSNGITKAEIIWTLRESFNRVYGKKGICSLDFRKLGVKTKTIDSYNKLKKRRLDEIGNMDKLVFVELEKPKSEMEKRVLEIYKKELLEHFENVAFTDRVESGEANLVLIHDMDYYKKREKADVKASIPESAVSQCITYETLKKMYDGSDSKHRKSSKVKNQEEEKDEKKKEFFSANINWVLSELLVKSELEKGVIQRWEYGEIEFYAGIRKKIKGEIYDYQCSLHIYEDGHFDISSDESEYSKYLNNEKKSHTVCIVEKDGNKNRITNTEMIPVVDYDGAKLLDEESKQNHNKNRTRGREAWENTAVYPYFGKTVMKHNERLHYCVGVENLKKNQRRMCNIYEITPIEGSDVIYKIIDMLEDICVRASLAEGVRPYPFKYMIEYMRKKYEVSDLNF